MRRSGPAGAVVADPTEAVLMALRVRGVATRAEIARITGISRTHAGRVVSDLVSRAVLVEVNPERGPARTRVGRPGTLVALAPPLGHCIGVDIAHRRVRVVAADLAHRVLAEQQVELAPEEDIEQVLGRVDSLISAIVPRCRPYGPLLGLGIALPGPVDATTRTASPSSIAPSWVGVPVADSLRDRWGVPVWVDNNGNLAALAEWLWGAGRDVDDLLYLKLDTGIGGGLISGGRLVRGSEGIGGELGHMTVRPDGTICRCGNRGCLETLANVTAFLDMVRPCYGSDLDLDTALGLVRDRAPAACRAIDDIGTVIGSAMATLVNVLNPQSILIGGPMAAADRPLLDAVRAEIGRRALPLAAERVTVGRSRLGDRAEVLGAVAAMVTDSRLALSPSAQAC